MLNIVLLSLQIWNSMVQSWILKEIYGGRWAAVEIWDPQFSLLLFERYCWLQVNKAAIFTAFFSPGPMQSQENDRHVLIEELCAESHLLQSGGTSVKQKAEKKKQEISLILILLCSITCGNILMGSAEWSAPIFKESMNSKYLVHHQDISIRTYKWF